MLSFLYIHNPNYDTRTTPVSAEQTFLYLLYILLIQLLCVQVPCNSYMVPHNYHFVPVIISSYFSHYWLSLFKKSMFALL